MPNIVTITRSIVTLIAIVSIAFFVADTAVKLTNPIPAAYTNTSVPTRTETLRDIQIKRKMETYEVPTITTPTTLNDPYYEGYYDALDEYNIDY